MIGEVREYTLTCADGHVYTVPLAKEVAAGLMVYRLPDGMHPHNPCRWRIGHEASGLAVADAMLREDAVKGAELLAGLADWAQDVASLRSALDPDTLYAKLSYVGCVQPNSEPMRTNVSRNGTYTDTDIEEAAAEAKASGFNSADILVAMAHTVPWMGLDTNEFNEAHDRIVRAANVD